MKVAAGYCGLLVALSLFALANANLKCNGFSELCDRTFDNVAYLRTHNAYSVLGKYVIPNQHRSIMKQLNEGVRSLDLDVYLYKGLENTILKKSAASQIYYCHSVCPIGAEKAESSLVEITKWLKKNRNEVISLAIENYIDNHEVLDSMFERSGIAELVYYKPDNTVPFPTLRQMIETNKRVVILQNKKHYASKYALNFNQHMNRNHYDINYPNQLGNCDLMTNDCKTNNCLYELNHFLTSQHNIISNPQIGQVANDQNVLRKSVNKCRQAWNKIPTFVGVDWYGTGHGLEIVDELNKVKRNKYPSRSALYSCPSTMMYTGNCNLLGACIKGSCKCIPPFSGYACQMLNGKDISGLSVKAIEGISKAVKKVFAAAKKSIETTKKIGKAAFEASKQIAKTVGKTLSNAGKKVKSAANAAKNGAKKLGKNIKNGAEKIGNNIKNGSKKLGNNIKNKAKSVGGKIKKLFGKK
ncbi:PI-PLC X domain-containing protein [Acrasis kona]|uniref:PI-PLC X domain-containing protein n=1 Tax=Acrasis kona TaxID=1008807 RepID=A0AAW2YS07_9EUKA